LVLPSGSEAVARLIVGKSSPLVALKAYLTKQLVTSLCTCVSSFHFKATLEHNSCCKTSLASETATKQHVPQQAVTVSTATKQQINLKWQSDTDLRALLVADHTTSVGVGEAFAI
jgi:hypothetical protein